MEHAATALVEYSSQELGNGRSPADVEQDLVAKGLDQGVASAFVERAASERRARGEPEAGEPYVPYAPRSERWRASAQQGSSGRADMATGGAICLIGIVITAVTYSAAASGGGTYVVAWGAIIFGAIQFFRGLARS